MEMFPIVSSWLTPYAGIHFAQKTLPTYGDNQKQLHEQL